jgi:hypothetical protein
MSIIDFLDLGRLVVNQFSDGEGSREDLAQVATTNHFKKIYTYGEFEKKKRERENICIIVLRKQGRIILHRKRTTLLKVLDDHSLFPFFSSYSWCVQINDLLTAQQDEGLRVAR